jgi:hypothetical protein
MRIAANLAAPRSPSLFQNWLHPPQDSAAACAGVSAASDDPCCTTYALPQDEAPASLGVMITEAATELARLATKAGMAGAVSWVGRFITKSGNSLVTSTPVAPFAPREGDFSRYELCDRPRSPRQLAVHPAGLYLLMTDKQGRVLLLDGSDVTVLRVWKGQRDATVGWLRNPAAVTCKSAHLVVIFAPRRCEVNLWEPFGQERLAFMKIRFRSEPPSRAHLVYLLQGSIPRCFLVQQYVSDTTKAVDVMAPTTSDALLADVPKAAGTDIAGPPSLTLTLRSSHVSSGISSSELVVV